MNLKKTISNFQRAVKKHSPEILTGVGIAGMLGGTVAAVMATPSASKKIEEKKTEKGESLTVKETIQVAWKDYVPATVSTLGGAACIIGASATNYKRNAALSTAYALSQKTFREFGTAVKETVSEKQYEEIEEKTARKQIENNPYVSSQVIITSKGTTKFLDDFSGRYFLSDIESIRRAINKANKMAIDNDSVSYGDFAFELNLGSSEFDDNWGWHRENYLIDIKFIPIILDNDDVIVKMDYGLNKPYQDFDR